MQDDGVTPPPSPLPDASRRRDISLESEMGSEYLRPLGRVKLWLKRDGPVMLLYAFVLSIMTYPLLFQLGEIIPLTNPDTYPAIYENWWMREALVNGYNMNDSPLLFYPEGFDLTLQPRRYASFPVWWVLYELFGEPTAYNLTILIELWVKAYAMYLFLMVMVNHRVSAWIGGALFAFTARGLSLALQQPDTGATEFIPLFMFAFASLMARLKSDKPLSTRAWLLWVLAAVLLYSGNVYQNLKIGVFGALVGGIYIAWITVFDGYWRIKRYWQTLILFGVGCLIVCAPVILSNFSAEYIDTAIDEFGLSAGVDLLSFIKPDMFQPLFVNPFIAQFTGVELNEYHETSLSNIGFLNFILFIIGAIYVIRHCRHELVWLVMALWFWGLSLGVEPTLNLEPIDWYWTPYRLVENNPLFLVLRNPYRFSMLMWFPMAVLIAYAVRWLSTKITVSRRIVTVGTVILFGLMLFEVSIFPLSHRSGRLASIFYSDHWENNPGAVIGIPMGRQQVKYQMYTQMWHRQPIHEGFIGRMPPDAYDYIKANPVLDDWQNLDDISVTLESWEAGIDALIEDGFRYVIVHKYVEAGQVDLFTTSPQRETFFSQSPTLYEDLETRVYELSVLKDHPPRILLTED